MSEILGVDAHPQLDQRGQRHQREHRGEGHVETEVGVVTVGALVLDHAVARPVEALAVAGAVCAAGRARHLAEEAVARVGVAQEVSARLHQAHDAIMLRCSHCSQPIHSVHRIFIVEPEQNITLTDYHYLHLRKISTFLKISTSHHMDEVASRNVVLYVMSKFQTLTK